MISGSLATRRACDARWVKQLRWRLALSRLARCGHETTLEVVAETEVRLGL